MPYMHCNVTLREVTCQKKNNKIPNPKKIISWLVQTGWYRKMCKNLRSKSLYVACVPGLERRGTC